ncbi:uncharacterized protein YkwD [Pullulanibacillus pueri]|nr:uncharacterized protein YkwD [Pullulanibacillus pueri]
MIAIIVFLLTFLFDFTNKDEKSSDGSPKIEYNKPTGFKVPTKGLYTYIGVSADQIKKNLGEPERVDPTAYGYDWWIYGSDSQKKYLQIGIEDNKVVTIFALGDELPTQPFKINEDASNIFKKVTLQDTLSLNYKQAQVEIEFEEDEMMVKPLIKFGDYYVQLYFDHFTNRLIGVRYWTSDILIKQRPYTIVYRGHLDTPSPPSEDQWKDIQQAESQETLEISNIFRKNHNLKPLQWDDNVAQAAYLHSKEMNDKNYFSHDSEAEGNLGDRLNAQGVQFQVAGENIAHNYTDGISAVMGWINSEGHRKNLLDKRFTQLGVGVYQKYYTQDFTKP